MEASGRLGSRGGWEYLAGKVFPGVVRLAPTYPLYSAVTIPELVQATDDHMSSLYELTPDGTAKRPFFVTSPWSYGCGIFETGCRRLYVTGRESSTGVEEGSCKQLQRPLLDVGD